MTKPPRLKAEQAGRIEAEMRHLEHDPEVSKRALRLFMQSLMPCGHAVGNLLTCPEPPFGCVVCGVMDGNDQHLNFERHLGDASVTVDHWPEWKQNVLGRGLRISQLLPTNERGDICECRCHGYHEVRAASCNHCRTEPQSNEASQ